MSDKKQLNDEELEQVNGGNLSKLIYTNGDLSKYNRYVLPVDKYSGVIGTKYLFRHADYWVFGELYNSYERTGLPTKRIHDIIVEDGYLPNSESGLISHTCFYVNEGGTREFDGDVFLMYRAVEWDYTNNN